MVEELDPRLIIDLSCNDHMINRFLDEWNIMKNKRINKRISYEDYIEWKINYIVEEDENEENYKY